MQWIKLRNCVIMDDKLRAHFSKFKVTQTPQMAKNHEISVYTFFDECDLSFMPRTTITSKFKMRWFPNKGRY